MIEQKAIYEAFQTAFSEYHPKFPWPKRHDLADQTDDFKRAMLAASTEINAMHEREVTQTRMNAHEAGKKAQRHEDYIQSLKEDNEGSFATVAAFIVGLALGALIIYAIL